MHTLFARSARWPRLAMSGLAAAGFSALLSSATPPPTPDLSIEDTLALAGRAVSFNYTGPSKNLDHLLPAPQKPLPEKRDIKKAPPVTQPVISPHPEKYAEKLAELKLSCPALSNIHEQYFNPALWLTKKVMPDLSAEKPFPRHFLEAAYFTIGYGPDTPEKAAALSELHKLIADSPSFIAFIDRKRATLKERLAHDPALQAARPLWTSMKPQKRQEILAYVAQLVISTLLPDNQVAPARVVYLTRNYKGTVGYGMYRSDFNEIYINGTDARIRGSLNFASEITTHETFHQFTSILSYWLEEGKLSRNRELTRQARFYHLFGLAGGSAVHISANSEGYRTSFGERGSWAFQLAASPFYTGSLQEDLFIDRYNSSGFPKKIAALPIYNPDSRAGTLPAACIK